LAVTIDPKLARKTIRKLHDSAVPVVSLTELQNVAQTVSSLNLEISDKAYIPSNGHGFLSLEKNMGVSRFLPILTSRDMIVYYQICGDIGDKVLVRQDGVFGGWHSVPTSQQVSNLALVAKDENAANLQTGHIFPRAFRAVCGSKSSSHLPTSFAH
jgi:hypothetical protein